MRASIVVGVVAVLVILLSSSVALSGALDKGSHELSGRASFDRASYSYEGEGIGSIMEIELIPGYGYFVADGWELTFGVPIMYMSEDWDFWSDESQTIIGVEFGVLYHFNSGGTTVPYVGAGLGFANASDSDDSDYETIFVAPALGAGLRVFLSESAALRLEAYYNHQQNAMFWKDVSGNAFGIRAGFSVFL